jgi:prevent-host-death family protein
MTLHGKEVEVGVRELHDRLSEYLEKVEQGTEVVVTRRGKRIARLAAIEAKRPLEDLERRGLVRWPTKPRRPRKAAIESDGPVSDFVAEQRR